MAEPIANDDIYSAVAGEAKTLGLVFNIFGNTVDLGGLLKNDIDEDGDTLSITSAEGESLVDGSVWVQGDNGGSFRIFDNGKFFFDASTGFEYLAAGETAETTITYTVFDGTSTSQATVTVTVTGVDGDELAAINDTFTVQATDAASAPLDLLANDNQDIGLTLTSVNGSGDDIDQTISGSEGGLFVVSADGTMTFDPNGEFEYLSEGDSATTSIEYTVTDANGNESTATVDVSVEGVNEGPTANDDSYSIEAGKALVLGMVRLNLSGDSRLLANDVDPDTSDQLTVESIGGVDLTDGIGAATGSNGGLFIVKADGTFTFDGSTGDLDYLVAGEEITTSVSYVISDGNGETDTAMVSVVVTGVNDAPVINDISRGRTQDQNYAINIDNLIANNVTDAEGDAITLTSFGLVTGKGSVGLSSNGLRIEFQTNGEFDSLAEGESELVIIEYTVADSHGAESTGYINLTINGLNDDPVANDDDGSSNLLHENSSVIIDSMDLLANDTDIDNAAILNVIDVSANLGEGQVTDNGDGTFTYDPQGVYDYLNNGETETVYLTYTVEDEFGGQDEAQVDVTIFGLDPVI